MDFDLLEFIMGNLEAAGVIGGYVAISILGVALITYALKDRMKENSQIGPKWSHPILGALLGVIPGCGATIVVSSMYKNRRITFGGLFATFIATLGEGSFVLLGASEEADVIGNLTAFLVVNVVGFIVGVILGYIVDALGIKTQTDKMPDLMAEGTTKDAVNSYSTVYSFVEKIGFYLILAMSLFLLPGSIMALWGGGIEAIADQSVWVATALAIVCIIYFIIKKIVSNKHCCAPQKNLYETLMHAVFDIALVVFYVFIGLFIANYIIDIVVGPERFDAWMTSSPILVVLIAAIIGATPGCGGMIAVAVAYITIPSLPLGALIAAAIATSGDGIFPLIAQNKKDALIITLSGLGVAVAVGYITLALGVSIR